MFLFDFYQMFLADMKMMWLHYIWLQVQVLHVFCFVSAGWNAGVQAGYLLPENETPLRTDFDEITDISYFSTLFHCMQLNSFSLHKHSFSGHWMLNFSHQGTKSDICPLVCGPWEHRKFVVLFSYFHEFK